MLPPTLMMQPLPGLDHQVGDYIFCMFVSVGEVVVDTFVCYLVLLYFRTKKANRVLKERVGTQTHFSISCVGVGFKLYRHFYDFDF